ncbi:MAG: DUF3667 domain-containing protein [Flavobacteriales bacterium]
MEHSRVNQCVSCGSALSGPYCAACGEKVVDLKERTLRHFLMQVLSAFTFADSRMMKSMKLMFFRPGLLAREYVDGKRKPYLSPLQFFFLINFVYFLVAPFDTFNTNFQSQTGGQPYSSLIHDYGVSQMDESGMEEAAFVATYNDHSSNISKIIILLLALLFAVPLMIFNFRWTYFFDHLMFSLSFISFLLLGVFIVLPYLLFSLWWMASAVGYNIQVNWNGTGVVAFALTVLGVYLFSALRTFYQQGLVTTIFKTLGLMLCLVVIVILYRFVLFFVTIWTL